MCSWNIFGAQMSHGQTWIHKPHHGPDLGEATTIPLIVFSMFGHMTNTQMSFCLVTCNGESRKFQNWDSHNFGRPITFVCKPLIEVRSKEKLQPLSIFFQRYVARHLHTRKSRRFPTLMLRSPSFGHNLCFNYPNGSCKSILDIHIPRAFPMI